MWTTNDLKQVFGVTPQTVRNWSTDFAEFLSNGATPEAAGTRRMFTEDDIKVFVLIREMTITGANYEKVKEALAKGKRGELPQLPVGKDDPTAMLSPEELFRTYSIMKERDEALGQLKQLQADRDEDRKTIERLNREIGRLEAELEMERKRNSTENSNQNSI